MQLTVTDREYHTIQAALRCWRNWLRVSLSDSDVLIDQLDAVATNDRKVRALSVVETDNLCMRLQAQADPAAQVERLCDLDTLQDDMAFLLVLLDRAYKRLPLSWLSVEERARYEAICHDAEGDTVVLEAEEGGAS